MKRIIIISIILFTGMGTFAQTRLEVEGEAKITILRNTTTSDENIVRKADGNLAIRKFSVGHFAHGGIVFWVDESGEHGLVAAKKNQKIGIRWDAGTYGFTQAKGDGIYSGEMNTAISIASQVALGDDGNLYAARVCSELQMTEGGKTYGDWYLPSKYELNKMFLARESINNTAADNGGLPLVVGFYWSSTEEEADSAWAQDFDDGSQPNATKGFAFRVRCIRAI